MSYFKLLGYNVSKKLTGSANSLFSTAVISGSSSAPNLKDMVPQHASAVAAIEGFGGVPPIRPLETLHNALSLRQLDVFLEMMTGVPLFRTPASSPPKFPSPVGPGPPGQQNLAIDAARYITPTPIQYKGSQDNELTDIRNQVSPTSPNSTGWSSEPASFLSSEPSSPAPTSTGECSMSMSLVSNDGSQQFSTGGAKFSPNRCLDLDFNEFCVNLDQETRESRGSVSYTDYYSNEDGQIRRTANDNCFPIFVKSATSQSTEENSSIENADDEEEHTLTLKQTEEQKKRDVQQIFEQKESSVKPSSSYKKIGRFRVESMEISDNDVRIKETSSLGSSVTSDKNKFLDSQQKLDASGLGAATSKGNNLLRSQSVYTPKIAAPSASRSPGLQKQSSLTATAAAGNSEAWTAEPKETAHTSETSPKGVDQPTLTLASSFTDRARVTFGFDLPQEKKE